MKAEVISIIIKQNKSYYFISFSPIYRGHKSFEVVSEETIKKELNENRYKLEETELPNVYLVYFEKSLTKEKDYIGMLISTHYNILCLKQIIRNSIKDKKLKREILRKFERFTFSTLVNLN